jgi:hypothetical protein
MRYFSFLAGQSYIKSRHTARTDLSLDGLTLLSELPEFFFFEPRVVVNVAMKMP